MHGKYKLARRPKASVQSQGGLTDLWLDDPYVVAASKLIAMAQEENANGRVFPVSMSSLASTGATCLLYSVDTLAQNSLLAACCMPAQHSSGRSC